MAQLSAQLLSDAGTTATFVAATASDTAPIGSGHDTFIVYKNGGGASITVTITSHALLDNGDAGPNHVVTIAAAGSADIPLRKSYDDGTGYATCVPSSTTSVTVAVKRLS